MQQFREIAGGKTRREVGRLSGVHFSTLQRWVSGDYPPTLDKAEQILNALGYDILIVKKK